MLSNNVRTTQWLKGKSRGGELYIRVGLRGAGRVPLDLRMVRYQCQVFTRTSQRYVWVFAIANPSVVCNVRAPYSGG